MQFACDSLPFRQPVVKTHLKLQGDLIHPKKIDKPNGARSSDPTQRFEPPRLVKGGRDGEVQHRTSFIPYTIVVAGDHAKTVCSGTEIGIDCLAPVADIPPTLILSFKPIAKANSFGYGQAQSGIDNLKVFGSSGQF